MNERIQEHYAATNPSGLLHRFESALVGAGFTNKPIDWARLAPIDQFHVRGLEALKELADGLGLAGKGESILDVGCGLGGPARYLAAEYGCRVTGIDLTPAYIEVAQMLGERTGLADQLTFVQGSALEMPFPNDQFDHAWTQHVAMNISDKHKLYQEVFRVLKPGGRLAIYDAVIGNGEPVYYPVPWAREAGISFLATPNEMQNALQAAGFGIVSSTDTTAQGLAWFAAMPAASAQTASEKPPFSLGLVLGADVKPMTQNFARNLAEGRLRLIQMIVQKH